MAFSDSTQNAALRIVALSTQMGWYTLTLSLVHTSVIVRLPFSATDTASLA